MSNYTEIKIDLELYKHIQSNLNDFNESPNNVIKRLLGLKKQPTANYKGGGISFNNGVFLPNGLELKKNLNGITHKAIIKDSAIMYNNLKFRSPSSAGKEASKTSVNGWIFWSYLDKNSGRWYLLDDLRKGRKITF